VYGNRARYLYVAGSPLEIEFDMERSSFKELAIEIDQSFLLRICETVDPMAAEIPDIWDHNDPLCWELAKVICDECVAGAANGSIYGETAMTLLALQIVRKLAARDRSPNFYMRGGLSPSILRRSCEYMIEHLDKDISLREMGELVGLSPGHFAYAFKRSTGVPPHAWLRRKRIEKAKELLRDRHLDVTMVARLVGYGSLSSFGVAFRKETGRTPMTWKRSL
jgi:AraC family transcriptional regulator